ncbi:MAG: DHH family phosphoesterase [Lachnospiraceae bacterium]|nr:DHH family phosphoesterase [Lachnospiraceae bacterium]
MDKKLTLEETARFLKDSVDDAIKKKKCFRIFYHIRPDGDAIGSAYSLALGLNMMGAKAVAVGSDPIPSVFRYLTDEAERQLAFDRSASETETFINIAVDTATSYRLGKNSSEPIDLCIDHHGTNEPGDGFYLPAEFRHVEAEASSCSEIIFSLLKAMGIEINGLMADLLYTGLLTDVSCFRTRSTTARSLQAAAELAVYGANIVDIARKHYMMKPIHRIEMEKLAYERIRFSKDENVAGTYLTLDDYIVNNVKDSDLRDFNTVIDQVCKRDGSPLPVRIMVREIEKGYCRISVMARSPVNAAKICSEVGGGGHNNSAGAEMAGDPVEVLNTIMKISEEIIFNTGIGAK